jgi:hypothetical protein
MVPQSVGSAKQATISKNLKIVKEDYLKPKPPCGLTRCLPTVKPYKVACLLTIAF